jgi:hypothetical protein
MNIKTFYRGWRIIAGETEATGEKVNSDEEFDIRRQVDQKAAIEAAKRKVDRIEAERLP